MAWGQMCHKCAVHWRNRGAFGVHNPQKAAANLAWVPTSLHSFFPPLHLKGFVGDIDIRQSSRTLTLAMSFENELMNQRKLPLIATRVSFVGTALHEDIRGWC